RPSRGLGRRLRPRAHAPGCHRDKDGHAGGLRPRSPDATARRGLRERPMKPRFFRSAADFRAWLAQNHGRAKELVLGFYNQRSGRKGIGYKEAVDEALCFGWIDGVRRSLDEDRYT